MSQRTDAAAFRAFCCHVIAVFESSPRCQLLNRLNAELRALAERDADVRWLLSDVLPAKRVGRTLCVSVLEERAALDMLPGATYSAWASLTERAETPSPLERELRARIAAGLRDKVRRRLALLSLTAQSPTRA